MAISLNGQGGAVEQPLIDPGNTFVGPHPAGLICGQVNGPAGPMVVLTVRSAGATLTVMMSREEALEWARLIRNTAQQITPLIVPPGALQ